MTMPPPRDCWSGIRERKPGLSALDIGQRTDRKALNNDRYGMITGTVTSLREATIHFPVRDAHGREHEVEAILDTGFTGSLTLPMNIITMLRLPWRSRGLVILANGTEDLCDMYDQKEQLSRSTIRLLVA